RSRRRGGLLDVLRGGGMLRVGGFVRSLGVELRSAHRPELATILVPSRSTHDGSANWSLLPVAGRAYFAAISARSSASRPALIASRTLTIRRAVKARLCSATSEMPSISEDRSR